MLTTFSVTAGGAEALRIDAIQSCGTGSSATGAKCPRTRSRKACSASIRAASAVSLRAASAIRARAASSSSPST